MALAISVIIPTYNRAELLPDAIHSVLDQTFGDYEIIVVDDGSLDNTREVIDAWVQESVVRYYRQDQAGVSSARNLGAQMASGKFLAFLDSDDLFLPTKLEKQIAVYQSDPDLGFVHCNFEKIDSHQRSLGVRDTSRFTGWIYPWMLQEWNVLIGPCTFVRKDIFDYFGGFDERMTWAEDLDLWRRIARQYRIGTVPEVLVHVRVHSANVSQYKVKAISDFQRYLDKAFADDPGLSPSFRRNAYARMYLQFARNLLGEGGRVEMRLARQLSLRALAQRPLGLKAILVWLVTLIPARLRARMAAWIRARRYSL